MSHSQAVYHLLRELQPQLKNTNITILGVHHINDNIIRYLSKNGASAIFVANRTFDKAKVLAEKYGAMAFDFTSLEERLKHTDVLITATAAPHLVVHANRFPVDKPMIVFDLAVPRDVDPEIGKLPEVRLFNIEDVEGRISQNVEQRQSSIEMAERIVIEEVANFRMTMERLQRYSPKRASGF
jgi:glutamyl-tRNA reductase